MTETGAVLWQVGPEFNWENVFCAFEGKRMIAKGQVQIIHVVPEGSPLDMDHRVYCNLKTVPERETDMALLEQVYQKVYDRAVEIKKTLSNQYKTKLCVGNLQLEKNNNAFFTSKGFDYRETVYEMSRNLDEAIPNIDLPTPYQFSYSSMNEPSEQEEYLTYDREIWPDASLGLERLIEYQNYPSWTALTVREGKELIASVMAWKEEDDPAVGIIEDVWVRKPWRKQGIAKFLLTKAMV